MSTPPAVRIEPGMCFGQPHVRGVTVDTIAEHVWTGDDLATIHAEHGISRPEMLVACWYLGTHAPSRSRWRKRWGAWAEASFLLLAGGDPYDEVPDPPTRPDTEVTG